MKKKKIKTIIIRSNLFFLGVLLHYLQMNFSPYSPSPDDDRSSRKPKSQQKRASSSVPTTYSSYQAGNADYSYAEQGLLGEQGSSSSMGGGGQTIRVNKYETTLPIRVDIEAALAYVLGPVTGKYCKLNAYKETKHYNCRYIVANSRETE